MAVQVFALEPWAQQPKEDDQDYGLFVKFRDTSPMERPTLLAELCRLAGLQDWEIKDIATRRDWIVRCIKYDLWLDAARRQAAIRAKYEQGSNMVRLSKSVIDKAERAFQWLEDNKVQPSYREAVEMVRLAIELNRAGLNLQGVGPKEREESQSSDSPAELIEAAVQVGIRIKRKVKNVTIDEDDIIENN
jgi:hypothetical protein